MRDRKKQLRTDYLIQFSCFPTSLWVFGLYGDHEARDTMTSMLKVTSDDMACASHDGHQLKEVYDG